MNLAIREAHKECRAIIKQGREKRKEYQQENLLSFKKLKAHRVAKGWSHSQCRYAKRSRDDSKRMALLPDNR